MGARTTTFRIGIGALALTIGCLSIDQIAPPVDPILQEIGRRDGIDAERLEAGRRIYLTDCARCHTPEPIGRYSAEKWQSILPRMFLETKLDEGREATLQAYVQAARAVIERNAADAEGRDHAQR